MKGCDGCGAAFIPAKPFHRLCRSCSQARFGSGPASPPRTGGVVLDIETARGALRLTHPDRHPPERQEQATRVTQALSAALDDARGLGRAA